MDVFLFLWPKANHPTTVTSLFETWNNLFNGFFYKENFENKIFLFSGRGIFWEGEEGADKKSYKVLIILGSLFEFRF